MKIYSAVVFCCFLGAGCSSSSSTNDDSIDGDNSTSATTLVGVFQDSFVSGINYSTETKNGVTDSNGNFDYLEGENITLTIGSLSFPTVIAGSIITPLDMSPNYNRESNVIINVARLLQSLDADGNSENGIEIPAGASSVASQVDFGLEPDQFENESAVINLIANSGSVTTSIIEQSVAMNHLSSTLDSINENAKAIGTGTAFLADGAVKLNDSELASAFSDSYFIEINGSWDWIFLSEGLASSKSPPRDGWTEGNQTWSVENGKLCRSLQDSSPCVSVYRKGNIYKFSLDGKDGTDNLETWTVRRIRSL